ncbi:ubiquinol-cytochrome c reductase iron-sulfur subunit [Paenibacillus ginsengarvi]|uniref:Rieske (2Fe-2S) protein n=1 Tax=Paenibacillus ginsengarvi TaxID=400777 RepID=A0A3B0CKL6_9BACL|nr:Rieske (2Fe-2S) protein [Paenibacillus ginsengarvi]RKN86235.1 Rieske (2Fe-2S) protein [Paenibacillus ginsengarvi]
MKGRLPKKITRRTFLSTSGKLGLGAVGILAGSTALFYYGAMKKKERVTPERPGSLVKLGGRNQLSTIKSFEKISYEATIRDAWVAKSVQGFLYVTNDAQDELLLMSPSCTHLGCSVEPVPEAGRSATDGLFFRCPCHGAEFDGWGNSVGSVALQGLDTFKPVIVDDEVYFDILAPIKGRPSSGASLK